MQMNEQEILSICKTVATQLPPGMVVMISGEEFSTSLQTGSDQDGKMNLATLAVLFGQIKRLTTETIERVAAQTSSGESRANFMQLIAMSEHSDISMQAKVQRFPQAG